MKLFVLLSCGLAAASALQKPPIKQFELDLTWSKRAVDGVEREQILVNGQFPGPALILDEGDDVEVTVNNFLSFNTTVHYHGIVQQGTPWSDGVPGVSQRLIAPGKQFVHKFTAMQYGTYWYHSHSRGQNMDGLYGPIYIRPRNIDASLVNAISNDSAARNQIKKAIQDPKLLMLSDWFHNTSEELREIALSANLDTICADSILINGKGRVRCVDPEYLTSLIPPQISPLLQGKNLTDKGCLSAHNTYAQTATPQHYNEIPPALFDECKATNSPDEEIKVNPQDGWVSLNLIGAVSITSLSFSINNHPLWVYEVDGQHIVPIKVNVLTLESGTRYSVLVQLNNQPGDYRITAASAGFNQKIAGYGTLSYVNGDPSVVGTSSLNYGGVPSTDAVVLDGLTIEPLIPDQPTQEPESTYLLTIGRFEKAWKWSLNGDNAYDLSLEKDRPLLWDPQSQEDSNLVIATKNGTWVDIIFEAAGNETTLQPGHPIHKHSNMLYVIGSGLGKFNWTTVAEAKEEIPESFNLVNPPMRDTFTTLPAFQGPSWMAIRYHVVNPGVRHALQVNLFDSY
ncbi:Multicopper oxidase type 2 [Penicillium brevicompactum]|uniref:Multicopper oxidase type 2 n=1 Tax=Penicillium brevicompactum TaxID=5074 RepID=UPI002540768A|nr:Multicopper oxidase type 2 [Penicillium brevicompactum]KAJ5347482.1 Multicopper oxidase type 2 [Penicillium brevicompactum]